MIELERLSIAYSGRNIIENCSITIESGVHAAFMGPSGCGKTTLLNAVAGLIRPDAGFISAGGSIAYAFQQPRLFPWLTAKQNISVVSGERKGADEHALLLLKSCGLLDSADKYPSELSGGMQQRVSICRALARKADILLLDEPLKGMDAALKQAVCALIKERCAGKTLLLVTHDESEAEALSDVVYDYTPKTFVMRAVG